MTPDAAHDWLKHGSVMMMTMRSDDASRWDVDKIVELGRSFSVGALGFSVGGVTAFYPTAVLGHPVCDGLDGRDLVRETIDGLHAAGIRAVGRVDPSLGSAAAFAAHPERFARSADGQPMQLHGYYLACPAGDHFGSYMLDVIREIVERYPLDGLWANAAQFSPWSSARCHCGNCVQGFEAEAGVPFPEEDWADPAWKRYNEWRYKRIADWNARVRAAIQAIRPACAWIPLSQVIESWDHIRKGGWDIDQTAPYSDGIVLEAQRRYCNLWWPGMEARYAHALDPAKGSGITVSYFYPWWRFTHAPVAENQAWVAQIVANGARPWLHLTGYFSEYFDRRGLAPMRQLLGYLRDNAAVYEDRASAAEVALVYSRTTLDYTGAADPDGNYLDGFRGAYNALMDGRVPFDLLSDQLLTAERLRRYRCVLLPNFACASDAAADALGAYMRGGGHVVATYRTGFCDAAGVERARSLPEIWLNAEYSGITYRDQKAAYALIKQPHHPVLRGIGDTDLLPLAYGVCVFALGAAQGGDVLRLIPPVEARAGSGMSVPEFNSATVSEIPLLLSQAVGAGLLHYFPWEPDRLAFSFGLRDPMQLLLGAVRAGPRWSDLVSVRGPGLLDCSVMDAPGSRVLHLVNFTSAGGLRSAHRRAVEETPPLHGLEISLRIPAQKAPRSVRLCVAGQDVPFTVVDDYVRFTVPVLQTFESALVHWH